MSEDKGRMATQEQLISLEHEWERRNWSQWLGCSEKELQHAVDSIGADPDNVRRFLRQARWARGLGDALPGAGQHRFQRGQVHRLSQVGADGDRRR